MKKLLMLIILLTSATGCGSLRLAKASHDAVKAGQIEGLSEDNQFEAILWRFPSRTRSGQREEPTKTC